MGIALRGVFELSTKRFDIQLRLVPMTFVTHIYHVQFGFKFNVCVCDSFSVCHPWSMCDNEFVTEQSSTILFVVFSRVMFCGVQTQYPVYEICTSINTVISNQYYFR